jgi:hypothetical protein
MIPRLTLTTLASIATLACADSTAPNGPSTETPTLSLLEYASQLRGDPLLTTVSAMLGRPEAMSAIDASLEAIDRSGSSNADAGSAIASTRRSLLSESSQDSTTALTENDVMAGVLTITLDRIAQVAESSAVSNALSSAKRRGESQNDQTCLVVVARNLAEPRRSPDNWRPDLVRLLYPGSRRGLPHKGSRLANSLPRQTPRRVPLGCAGPQG